MNGTEMTWPRVGVVGAGAVGCFFGGMLARAGAPTTFIGRPRKRSAHLERIREHGLVFDGVEVQEKIAVEVAEGYEVLSRVDLVLFAVKTLDTESAAAAIQPHLAAGALVVSLQNGIENVEQLLAADIRALPAVVFVAAAIETPGVLKHRGRGDLIIGDDEHRAEVERVAAWFEAAGVPCPISRHIRREQWLKLILNSMANATSALTGASYRRLVEFEPTWEIARAVAREAVAVAAADGNAIDVEEVIALGTGVARSVGEATSSTQQDIARGRRTEIDSLNGYISRRGAELGVATPTSDMLTALVKLREITPEREDEPHGDR